jgi:hypothetical protein
MMVPQEVQSPTTADPAPMEGPAWRLRLLGWMVGLMLVYSVLWGVGIRQHYLATAVEAGVARVEQRLQGEESQDIIRKEIQVQRDSLRFWMVLAALGDFVFAPLWLPLRAMSVTVVLSAWAALRGRPPGFLAAWCQCVTWQGIWVLGAAVQVVLAVMLDSASVDTSVALLLPPGTYSAGRWILLRQLDCFALFGWLVLAWGGYRRGQAGWGPALLLIAMVAIMEAMVVSSASLVVELGMRLSLMP